jgi:hypothetical protein
MINMHPKLLNMKIQGQGLIESLMIAVFVGFNAVAFIGFQNYLTYNTELLQQQFDANLIAKSRIESLRYFSVLATTSGYNAYQDIATGTENLTVGNTTYTSSWTVTTNTSPSYKNISETVSWTDRRSTARSISLVSNIASSDPSIPASFM